VTDIRIKATNIDSLKLLLSGERISNVCIAIIADQNDEK
jgi:hypothetical protein